MRPSLLLRLGFLLALLAGLAAPPASAQSQWPTCSTLDHELFISFFQLKPEEPPIYSYTVSVWDETGKLVSQQTGLDADRNVISGGGNVTSTHQECDWIAETNGAGTPRPGGVVLAPGIVYTIEIYEETTQTVSARYTYFLTNPASPPPPPGTACPDAEDGFYCPNGITSAIDEDLFIVASPFGAVTLPSVFLSQMQPNSAVPGLESLFNTADKKRWILPYNLDVVCDSPDIACPPDVLDLDLFVTRQTGSPYTPVAFDWTFADHDLEQRPGKTWDWLNQTARFQPGNDLTINGTFDATNTTFTASDPASGWGGIRFEDGSGGVMDGVIVESVSGWGTYAVRIYDASPTISGSRIQDSITPSAVGGILVSGSQADPTIEDTFIENLTGDGITVWSGARAQLVENEVTFVDDALVVSGTGTEVFASPPPGEDCGNQFVGNSGSGVYSSSGGDVYMGYHYWPYGIVDAKGYNSATGNGGRGLHAAYSGYVGAGHTSILDRNRIFSNTSDDALADGSGSSVTALCNWWNDVTPPFRTAEVNGGNVSDYRWLTADPYLNANPPCVDGSGKLSDSRTSASKGSGVPTSAHDRIGQASATAHEDPAGALAALSLLADEYPSLASVVLAELARVGARGDASPVTRAAATSLLEARLAQAPHRRAAERGLLRLRYASGDVNGAISLAEALAESDEAGDRVLGLVAQVALLSEGGRLDDAATALAALEAEGSAHREVALARADLVARGFALAPAQGITAKQAESADLVEDSAGATRLGVVYPNPTAGGATVPLTLSETSRVRVAVYDVLGREVAVLADGAAEAGRHEIALVGSEWAPGVYLVHARVAGEGGGTETFVRRFTLVRR